MRVAFHGRYRDPCSCCSPPSCSHRTTDIIHANTSVHGTARVTLDPFCLCSGAANYSPALLPSNRVFAKRAALGGHRPALEAGSHPSCGTWVIPGDARGVSHARLARIYTTCACQPRDACKHTESLPNSGELSAECPRATRDSHTSVCMSALNHARKFCEPAQPRARAPALPVQSLCLPVPGYLEGGVGDRESGTTTCAGRTGMQTRCGVRPGGSRA
jgi:hypothetical protein